MPHTTHATPEGLHDCGQLFFRNLKMPTYRRRLSVSGMTDDSFQQEVLDELGDHRLQEIADALDTDTGAAAAVVGTSVSTLSGELKDAAETPDQAGEVRDALGELTEPPLRGAVTLGGGLGGGLMAGVLARLARPAAAAVAERTGMPVATVSKAFELLIPVVLTVLTRRAANRRSPGAAPGTPGAPGAGVGDVLGDLLGGGRKRP